MERIAEQTVDVFDKFVSSRLENIHTILPGKITEYSGHGTRKATVKPLVKVKTINGTDVAIPPIDNVPVIFPSSSAFSLLFPVKKGDGCLIVFSEVGIGNYLNNTEEVTADDLSRFSLTDAICIPGLWSFNSVPDSKGTIEITEAGVINLNGDSKSFVTHAELNTALQTFITALNLHVHSGVTTGGSSSGPPLSSMSLDISASETEKVKTGG